MAAVARAIAEGRKQYAKLFDRVAAFRAAVKP